MHRSSVHKRTTKRTIKHLDVFAGILYCDITDHLPCYVLLLCSTVPRGNDRPMTRIFNERNSSKFRKLMNEEIWQVIYRSNADWYEIFLSKIKVIYNKSFPVVKVSRLRIKDKIWITKGLRKCVKTNLKLYQASLHSDDPTIKANYKRYKNILRLCLTHTIMTYLLKQKTQPSIYGNIWGR